MGWMGLDARRVEFEVQRVELDVRKVELDGRRVQFGVRRVVFDVRKVVFEVQEVQFDLREVVFELRRMAVEARRVEREARKVEIGYSEDIEKRTGSLIALESQGRCGLGPQSRGRAIGCLAVSRAARSSPGAPPWMTVPGQRRSRWMAKTNSSRPASCGCGAGARACCRSGSNGRRVSASCRGSLRGWG